MDTPLRRTAAIHRHPARAFTLLELTVTLVILGLLAAIMLPTYAELTKRSKDRAALVELAAAHRAAWATSRLEAANDPTYREDAFDGPLHTRFDGTPSTAHGDVSAAIDGSGNVLLMAMRSSSGRCVLYRAENGNAVATAIRNTPAGECAADAAQALPPDPTGGPDTPTTPPTSTVSPVWVTGTNDTLHLGIPGVTSVNTLTRADSAPSDAVAAFASQYSTVLLTRSGHVWVAGDNWSGSIGLGDDTWDSDSFVQVPDLDHVVGISAGYASTYAVKSDGTLWVTGYNHDGALGLGSGVEAVTRFTKVNIDNVVAVVGSEYNAAVLRSDGTVWTTGKGYYGYLGQGDTTDRFEFTQVPGLAGVTQLAGSGHNLFAIKADRTLWATGWNQEGELGLGDQTKRLSFTKVPGLTDVAQVAASGLHTLVRRTDGSVLASGYNWSGVLGVGDTNDRLTFTPVAGLPGPASDISANVYLTLVLVNGRVYAAGSNSNGELGLGDGDTMDKSTFTLMPGSDGAKALSAGRGHAVLIR